MKKIVLAILLGLTPFSVSQADKGWFLGGGGGFMTFDDGFDSVDPLNLFVRGGYSFGQYFEIGGEYSFTLSSDSVGPVDFDVDTTFVFLKGKLPVSDSTQLYALVGPSTVDLTGSLGNVSASFDDSGTGVGVGVQFQTSGSTYFHIDYIKYYDDDQFDNVRADVSVDAINIGFVNYFQ